MDKRNEAKNSPFVFSPVEEKLQDTSLFIDPLNSQEVTIRWPIIDNSGKPLVTQASNLPSASLAQVIPWPQPVVERPSIKSASSTKRLARLSSIDFARGLAISLMILSHGVKGLLAFEQMPEWGIVPVHLMTKFSSSLFILIFGMALGVAYLPQVNSELWYLKRRKLLFRSVEIMFWYKALTIVQMFQFYPKDQIVDVLLFRGFPDFVEVLGFYSLALLWVPFFLPIWRKLDSVGKTLTILTPILLQIFLPKHFDFWGFSSLKAMIVENRGDFTFGQISRAPLIFVGLWLGELVRRNSTSLGGTLKLILIFLFLGSISAGVFYFLAKDNFTYYFMAMAKNWGKHPPNLIFMSFSLAGAFLLLSLSFAGGKVLSLVLWPITLVGQNALQAFIAHIVIIFVGYRWLLGFHRSVSYEKALSLSILTILLSGLWVGYLKWRKLKLSSA